MSLSNAQAPAHVSARHTGADADYAAMDKLPARLREAIQNAPFEISAVSVYEVWLRTQVRTGPGEALTYTLGLIDCWIAEALRG